MENGSLEDLQFLVIKVNEKEVKALINTGSQVMTIALQCYERLPAKPKLDKTRVKLFSAGCNKLDIAGEARFCFKIEEAESEIWVPCIVIKNLAADDILGMNTQKALGLILDPARGLVTCKSKE